MLCARVLNGEHYVSPLIAEDTVNSLLWSRIDPQEKLLSIRQVQILQLLGEGKCMREIAHILQIKLCRVASHKYRIMNILGIEHDAALIEYAVTRHFRSSYRWESPLPGL